MTLEFGPFSLKTQINADCADFYVNFGSPFYLCASIRVNLRPNKKAKVEGQLSSLLSNHLPVVDHQPDSGKGLHILQRVAIHHQHVGDFAGL